MQVEYAFSYKYQIRPTKSQITKLENTFSMCRHLYNWYLKEKIEFYENEKISISKYDQFKKLPQLKIERPHFKFVHSQVLQNVIDRMHVAYKNFFRRVKEAKLPASEYGFPKFKKRGQWNSITYPQFRSIPKNKLITIPKIGDIKMIYHRDLPDNCQIKTLTIVKEGQKWFVCFSLIVKKCITELKQTFNNGKFVGIDLGISEFWTTSSNETCGETIEFFTKLKLLEKKKDKINKKLSKIPKRTKKYLKFLRILQNCHHKIKCFRNDFLHKQANKLLQMYDLIIFESLNIKKMVRRPKKKPNDDGSFAPNGAKEKSKLNKKIHTFSWGIFLEILKYKAKIFGKQIVEVNPFLTSQKCSNCGEIIRKTLSTRTHMCSECGFVANRDHNAAINILRLGIQSLGISLEAPTIAQA